MCKIIWKSPEDAAFVKKVGKRKGEWVGCDKKGCNYWGIARFHCSIALIVHLKALTMILTLCLPPLAWHHYFGIFPYVLSLALMHKHPCPFEVQAAYLFHRNMFETYFDKFDACQRKKVLRF